jgi:type IV secretion system protein VirB10
MEDPMVEQTTPPPERTVSVGSRVLDYRRTPLGVMPRQLQRWLLLGTAMVMVGIMALSGGPTRSRATSTPSSATAVVVDPNQQRIEEYQRRIQEQSQRLAAEQAQLHVVKDALSSTGSPGPSSGYDGHEPTGTVRSGPAGIVISGPSTKSDTLQHERAQREYRSLFADNVAFSREAHAQAPATPAPVPAAEPRAGTPAVTAGPVSSDERTYRVPEGTIIETVLTNRLDGTYAGPVNCLVTTAVYAPDRQHLLIPAGARVLGEARAVNTFGQSRLAIVFHRVVLPNGGRVDLESFHGLNQIGETGLRDQVDRHYAQIFGASLAVGAIAGFAHGQTSVGPWGPGGADATALDAYRQGAASNLAQSSARILDRFLNLLPTVTIREGHRIKVYLSNDLELPAYRDEASRTAAVPHPDTAHKE